MDVEGLEIEIINKIGVYGPWRSFKKNNNKNLSQIPIDNWFKWD
tara:strand:+ start:254 stop:385 length:132 start_codon:yes stop_codon:yes gene_type:complete